MSKTELTPQQALAATRKSTLLVSAAAGSGKTRVLTARLTACVTDDEDPCDIDDFLVITYTRAAASELRGRIANELSRLSGEAPQNRRLRRQVMKSYQAHIGTIHSFCAAVLRENGHHLDLSPDFSVGDEDKCRRLKQKALDKTLEAAYERIAVDEGFAALTESVGAGRDDSRLIKAVLDLHGKLQSHPYPERWAREQESAMDLSEISDIGQTIWGKALLEDAGRTALFWIKRLDDLWFGLCGSPEENAPLITAYGESVTETMQALAAFSKALESGWDSACKALPIPFPRLKPVRGYEFEDRKGAFTALRDECKTACKGLEVIFDAPSEKHLNDLEKTFPAMKALLALTVDFDRRYAGEKRRRNMLDFSDLEHLAVRLLCDEKTGGPTAIARELSRRYREILVDEYQDLSAVQELILQCASRDGGNVFMVGDVKQSIYRFRLADPGIFLQKLESFPRAEDAGPGESAAVLLKNNFRSDRRVLSACNAVFGVLMSKRLGDIDYDSECALYPPDNAPPSRGEAKFTVVATGGDEDERPDKTAIEARFVASRIKAMVEAGETVLENGEERPLRYGDFAVLLRSPGSSGAVYKNVLANCGVPVAARQAGGFFDAPEIVVLTALLSVVDNPRRDVPLTAVLNSPVCGFTPDELARLRAADRDGDLFAALTAFSGENEKARAFLGLLVELRALSYDLSVYELISYIKEKLSLSALWTAARRSGSAADNIALYLSLAAQFESGGWRGLPEFLSRLKTMEERGAEPAAPEMGAAQGVSVMSIHKAKGLEFPVVFLCDTARKFNKTDLAAPVLVHPGLGLGGRVTDPRRGIEYPGIAYRAIRSALRAELLSEEMRVLYVALTRAREKLFITCTASDPEAFIKKYSAGMYYPPDAEILRASGSMAQWLAIASLSGAEGAPELETAEPERTENARESADEGSVPSPVPEDALEALRQALDYRYPYEYAAKLPSKLTATALTRGEADDEAAQLLPALRSFDMPDFLSKERPLTAAEKGTATHTVMQFIDFSKASSLEDIASEIERIRSLGLLDIRQARAVDADAVLRFFSSETGRRILASDEVMREFRFSVLVPASSFYPDAGEETLLLQGVIDCCIDEGGSLTVIDYKTDYVTPETLDEKAAHYKPQLDAYALAMERITGKAVKGSILVFLRAGLEAKL